MEIKNELIEISMSFIGKCPKKWKEEFYIKEMYDVNNKMVPCSGCPYYESTKDVSCNPFLLTEWSKKKLLRMEKIELIEKL